MNPLLQPSVQPVVPPMLTGSDLQAMARSRNPVIEAWEPSLRERMGNAVYDFADGIGLGGQAHRMRREAQSLADFVPGLGGILGADEAGDAASQGDFFNAMLAGAGLIPGAAPAGKALRQRYAPFIREATGKSDVYRLKMTPERYQATIDSFKAYRAQMDAWKRQLQASDSAGTPQMQQARGFAEQMVRDGRDVRFKIPDGPKGSLYVRVGDEGTVRFADHPQPTEGGQVVGGYSKSLGRRHHPATHSVSPGEMALDDILNIYGAQK